ncbi:enoyl-CoA hydratase-related protein [Williamsia deligens]|uniref:Enoyl-CoA hydratase-related protein n=1 Tax=Williamsia deligens TaxID=321325 RepID=A0ABW3G696_9NOCA|nr:enoyl-CoA hydratase-related protein [Williamsia deligens]MCP2194874.1 acetyl-CoA C-acetyltransferase [Williamsia deligens]
MTSDDLDPRTPVLVGVGEASERIDDPDYAARSEAQMAADALTAALQDTGAQLAPLIAAIDDAAMTRSFEGMGFATPLGAPTNYPWAVLRRIGAEPRRVVYDALGGQTPQSLVTEMCGRIAAGAAEVAVVFGADVTSTTRHLASDATPADARPDFTETVDAGPTEDRGRGTHLVNTRDNVLHGLTNAPAQYGMLENARRHRLGLDRERYMQSMAELFAPFSAVAADNPHSAAPTQRSVDELATRTERNRPVADPYLRFLVARDQINQGAACVMTSVGAARRLGIDPARWVFLHGHADLRERPLLERPDLSRGPAAVAAVRHALELADVTVDDVDAFDLYSCFPVAVWTVTDAFGLAADDPRGLTVTGGLPYFGGAGSNYSTHAIAGIVRRARATPGSVGLVAANGGQLSKYSVGVYSTTPRPWTPDESAAVQDALDTVEGPATVRHAHGPATVETWTVHHGRRGARVATCVCRDLAGRRFLATVCDEDHALLDRLTGDDGTDDPVGTTVYARHVHPCNHVATSRAAMDRLHPSTIPSLDRTFEHVRVRRSGHVCEIELHRPDVGNALSQAAHAELDEVVSAFLADTDLWVAIVHGAGDDFCVGVDMDEVGWGSTAVTPPTGVAGITARTLDKPIIAAVAGAAHDAGLELVLACHLVVAARDATFALGQVSTGLIAEDGGLVRLPRIVGERLATEMTIASRVLDADAALRAGLVNRVVGVGDHLTAARELAESVVENSPFAVRQSLRSRSAVAGIADPVEATRRPSTAVDAMTFSQDLLLGMAALRDGDKPVWTNT